MPHRYAFSNVTKIDNVYNAKNRTWQGIHDSITTVKHLELFEIEFIVQGYQPNIDSTRNKHCMTELLLLDSTKVLCLFDTGSNVNLMSVIKSSKHLQNFPKDDYILHTTALVLPDFGSVKFLLSISSMDHLNTMIDVSSRQISICKKSFVFKTCFHNTVKAHDTMTICIKCTLPK